MNGPESAPTLAPVDHDPFADAPPAGGEASAPGAAPAEDASPSPDRVALRPVAHDPFADAPPPADGVPGEVVVVPTTDSQRELWLSAQMGDDANRAYIQPFTVRLRGPLDERALLAALEAIVARHEALRTTFSADGLSQRIAPTAEAPFELVDLTGRDEDDVAEELARLEDRDAHATLDLAAGPLWRATLVRVSEQDHALLLALHHIVADGWSVGVVLQELGELYSAAARGEEAELRAPERFVDFAREVTGEEGRADAEEALPWWRGRFARPVEPLELPTDRARPPHKTYAGARVDRRLDGAFLRDLKGLGARHGCTQVGTLLAGFLAFLHRLTGGQDLVVGVPAAAQALGGRIGLVGHCVHLLPVRQQVSGDRSFTWLLREVRERLLEAYEHPSVTTGRLLESLKLHRDPSRLPLVSVILNHIEHETELAFEGLDVEYRYRPRAFEIFEWQLNVEVVEDGAELQLNYNTDLFDEASVERRLEEFETLLRALAAAPDAAIASLPLLGARERELLERFNDTEPRGPLPGLVHERVRLAAAERPDEVALSCDGRSFTRGELQARADRLARRLAEEGFRPGDLAAVCLERSPEMLVALLAVLNAGGAYVPLDPTHPAARLAYVLEDSEATLLLTQGTVQARLPRHGAKTLLLDDEALFTDGPADPPDIEVPRESLAYVIYTSGSTGKPKGVEVPHRALANFLASMEREPGLGADDVLVAVTTLAFDIAGLELFLPLVTGARLVLAGAHVTADGESLMALLARSGATVMQATPATWRLMIEAGWAGDSGLKALCGGEAITPELVEQLRPRVRELWNMYGPTETTIWSTIARLEPREPVTIGRPIDRTQVHVLDGNLQRLPVGVVGEIHIGGEGVARGYRHRPGLTAERFLRDRFRTEPGAKLYKTGDLGRFRADGRLECLGRIDHQVKIRGYRIELGEIEAVLEAHPEVRSAVVIDREDEKTGRYLEAWFVAEAGERPSRTSLREHLAKQLPDYMIPPVFGELDSIPRTPNNKVDRAALPQAKGSRLEVERHVAEPRDDIELRLQALWRRVLGVERVGVSDDFFDLGGHSLLAVRLLGEVETSFGWTVPLPRLLEAPTIEQLATLLRRGERPVRLDELMVLREASGETTRPPVFFICGIFLYRALAQRLHEGHPAYAAFLQAEVEMLHAGSEARAPSVEEMAARYLELVRRERPEGPYVLAGVSFGGVLAFEMAQQLRAAGEDVPLVALLDAPRTGDRRPSLARRAMFHARKVRREGAGYLARRLRGGAADPVLEVDPVQAGEGAARTAELGALRQRLFLDAMRRYRARPYDGRLELFTASRRSEAEQLVGDPIEAWRAVAPALLVHTVPGDHLGILREPNVEVLGSKLQASLDAALGVGEG